MDHSLSVRGRSGKDLVPVVEAVADSRNGN
jgi:hypothetical protein